MKNLEDYKTCEKVEDMGEEKIGSHWVITHKEKHDRQNTDYKGRLVMRGFQELEKLQSDSPTVTKESLNLFMAVVKKNDFELSSVDIRAAYPQMKKF